MNAAMIPKRVCNDCKVEFNQTPKQFAKCVGKCAPCRREREKNPRQPVQIADFRARIEARSVPVPESGCWLWLMARDPDGYGIYTVPAIGEQRAHRISYMAFVGPIPDGLQIRHKCDTPACVNPFHLCVGDHLANMDDMRRKNRAARGLSPSDKDECVNGHALNAENLVWRKGCKSCRRCENARSRKSYAATRSATARRASAIAALEGNGHG